MGVANTVEFYDLRFLTNKNTYNNNNDNKRKNKNNTLLGVYTDAHSDDITR